MNAIELLLHLTGLLLPALLMAALMPLAGRWVMGAGGLVWFWRAFWHALAGSAVLVLGLLLQGHDGRMATYGALVLVAATLEWLMHRGWQKR